MKLSIITVCRNEAERIQRTIDSVVNQSTKDFEWVVVDGGSTDGTLALFEAHRDRIATFVSEPDSGIYNAMNKGTELAAGDYLLFLNGGDWLNDEQVVADFLSQDASSDIIVGDISVHLTNGKVIYRASADIGTRVRPDRITI